MKFTTSLTILALTLTATAIPTVRQAFNPGTLLPAFGVEPNTDRDFKGQVGSCRGIKPDGSPVAIQCSVKPAPGETFTEFSCPPDRALFDAKLAEAVAAGKVSAVNKDGRTVDTFITFSMDPSDISPAAIKARGTAGLILLQSFSGYFGKGCPAVAAPNFSKMQLEGVVSDQVLVSAGRRA